MSSRPAPKPAPRSSAAGSPPQEGIAPARRAALRALIALDRRGMLPTAPGDDESPRTASPDSTRDRALAERLTRGVLRRRLLLDALLERLGGVNLRRTAEPLLWVLRLAAYEKIFQRGTPDYAIGAQCVDLARSVGGPPAGRFANAIVRRLLPALPPDEAALAGWVAQAELSDAQRWSIPEPLLAAFCGGYGEAEGLAVAAALAEREAPVWLRANRLRLEPGALIPTLEAEGCLCAAGPADAAGGEFARWTGGTPPWQTEAWRRGACTVQDLGAGLACALFTPPPAGAAVLDLCAAPGGKTGQLWEALNATRGSGPAGRLVALEVDPRRRATLRENLRRLYGEHAIELPALDSPERLPAGAQFDRILIDTPCLALGLIGRHPEVRWDGRLTGRAEMNAQQRRILKAGAARARPGAELIWVTCSPTREENEGIIAAFLAAHPEWSLAQPAAGEAAGGAAMPAWVQAEGGTLRTRPDLAECDGFAITRLRRHGG